MSHRPLPGEGPRGAGVAAAAAAPSPSTQALFPLRLPWAIGDSIDRAVWSGVRSVGWSLSMASQGGMRFLIKSGGLEKGCQGKRQFLHQVWGDQVSACLCACVCVQEPEEERERLHLLYFTSLEPVLILRTFCKLHLFFMVIFISNYDFCFNLLCLQIKLASLR